jgi:predicted nucleic acid-binding protein
MIKRIYIDTSVFGGYFDAEFEVSTKLFFEEVQNQKIKIVISEILELELYKAPQHVIDFYETIPEEIQEKVELTNEAKELADKYILEKVVGKTSKTDCQHIAIATVSRADVLVSWNFKHIVNLEKIRGYNSINFREGYPMIEIRTPKEIFGHESD